MGSEINDLKSVLRSLVVSSPTQMDVRTLLRDYRNMVGAPLPLTKYGHRDPIAFLKERFSDCFLFTGHPLNPVLTLIVPDALKHIDKFVQKQKVPSTSKCKSKRRSVNIDKPCNENLIVKTFVKSAQAVPKQPKKPEIKAPDNTKEEKENVDFKNDTVTSNDVKNFLKKRLPLYNSLHNFEESLSERDVTLSLSLDDDSGKQTSSSSNSTKALQFEELKSEIMELICASPEGVWCTDLIKLYRDRYKCELNFSRFGYTSIISLVYVLEERVLITRPLDTGDWLLQERSRAPPARLAPRGSAPAAGPPPRGSAPAAGPPPRGSTAPRSRARCPAPTRCLQADPDDALPGIDFDPDVFPEDCMHFMESIPSIPLADCRPGAMLEIIVGEVYSPSHFWFIRLGDKYNIAMEDMMDDMTCYYNGEGRQRALARGAIRVGHYCSSLYDNDWHRSLIVKIVDSDTVKVRHVDYGTVDTVQTSALRPLRREWARLPAQAARARLAAVRPSAAGRRWPRAAAAHFLRLVRDTRLVANVVAVDPEEDVIETLLIDTAGAQDLNVSDELIRSGHADARPDSALRTAECYLYPRFEALESGDTPSFAEIQAYLRDGIALDYVHAYRQHVPLCLPAALPARPAAPPPASPSPASPSPAAEAPTPADSSSSEPPHDTTPELAIRIPLLWPCATPSSPVTSLSSLPPPRSNNPPASTSPPARPSPSQRPSPSPPPATTASAPPPGTAPVPLPETAPALPPGTAPVPLPATVPAPLPATAPAPLAATVPAPLPATAPAPLAATAPAPLPGTAPAPLPSTAPALLPATAPAPPPTAAPAPPPLAPGLYPLADVFPPPPGALPAGQWFGPYLRPPAPYGIVSLSLAECETYRMLVGVNPAAAHWYMAGALSRAMGPAGVGPGPGPVPRGPVPPVGTRGPPGTFGRPSQPGSQGPFGPPVPFGPAGLMHPSGTMRPPPGFGT